MYENVSNGAQRGKYVEIHRNTWNLLPYRAG